MAEWVRALAWAGDRTVSRPGSNPATVTSLRNFGNSVSPPCQCLSEETLKSRRSLLSGVYARGSKRSHQSALECVTVVDSTTHSKNSPTPRVRLCGGKRCPALVSEEEEEESFPKMPPSSQQNLLVLGFQILVETLRVPFLITSLDY